MREIYYIKEANEDIKKLDRSQQIQVLKAIKKVGKNPLSQTEGGYGKPLGNKNNLNLHGLLKIKLLKLGIRVVYKIVIEDKIMKIIVISARAEEEAYVLAEKRKDYC